MVQSCQTACQLRAIFASQGAGAGEIMCDFRQPECRCRGNYVRFSQARVQALGKLCAIFASLGAGAGGNYVRFSRAREQALGKLCAIFASLGAGAGEIMCDFCQPGSWGNYVGFVGTRPQAPLESLELSGGDAQAVCELRGSRAGDLFAQGRRAGGAPAVRPASLARSAARVRLQARSLWLMNGQCGLTLEVTDLRFQEPRRECPL